MPALPRRVTPDGAVAFAGAARPQPRTVTASPMHAALSHVALRHAAFRPARRFVWAVAAPSGHSRV
ncbi:hypothetical protein GCM10008959_09390 [Deinococcus seoulensis]|uniref:Uncharacterized protein n=1 Tax=Deinococcus seoulensis TaxID=1837379 RepID=A0ABQ2RMR9_9DEIO|nr:hypothetical protein GCM10008959_09390 [Deinococcus seoulensis]